jgi:drug/metabolite transporter (DMT)-like permease
VTAIVLALLASLGWGSADFLGGLRARHLPLRAVVCGMMAGGLALALLLAAVTGSGYPGNGVLLAGVVAGVSSMVAVSTLYKALAIGSMSIVSPISAAYPVVPVVWGLLQGERPSGLQYAGMALVVAGVVTASYVRGPAAGDAAGDGAAVVPLPDVGEGLVERLRRDAAAHRPRLLASVALAVVAALASGMVLTALSAAATTDPYWGLIVLRTTGLAGLLVVVAAHRGLGVPLRRFPALMGIGALDTAATGLFAVATTYGYLSIVSVIASLFPVTVLALARVGLGERVRPHQAAGIAAALSGVALLAVA